MNAVAMMLEDDGEDDGDDIFCPADRVVEAGLHKASLKASALAMSDQEFDKRFQQAMVANFARLPIQPHGDWSNKKIECWVCVFC